MFRNPFKEALALLRAINYRTHIMAIDTSKLNAVVQKLVGDVQTLISIARKGNTNPTDQAAVDAIANSLSQLDLAVAQADSDLGPTGATGATGPDGSTGATGPDGTTGATGA